MEYSNRDDLIKKYIEYIKQDSPDFYNYIIPEQYTLKLTSYISIQDDLIFAVNATKKLIEIHTKYPTPQENPEMIYEPGLWYSIIVTYGKLFTDASNAKRSKLEEREIFDSLDKTNELYNTHTDLMDLRHNFVAHRGDSDLDNILIILKIPKSLDPTKMAFDVKTVRAYAQGTQYFHNYLKLFNYILPIIETKIEKQSEKLLKFIANQPSTFLPPFLI